MRLLPALAALLAASAAAQPATQAAPTPPAERTAERATAERTVHALPFGPGAHAVELAVGGAAPDGAAGGPYRVEVAAAPPWVAVAERSVAVKGGAEPGGESVGRVAFSLAADAPVGVPGEIALRVVGPGGAVVAERSVWVEVAAPAELSLLPPRPNPSRGAVAVSFEVPAAGYVRLSAFDVLGREVAVLADGEVEAGAHEGRLAPGALAAGVYVVRLVSEGPGGAEARVRRFTVVR